MTSQTLREARKYEQASEKLIKKEERPDFFELDGRRVMIGWMQNWDTCNLRSPEAPWFGQMSLPRELSVKNGRLYIGRYSETGLTTFSIIYPIQLLMIALAVGTGAGINTSIAFQLGIKEHKRAEEIAGMGTPLALIMWLLFAGTCYFIMPAYARMSTDSEIIIQEIILYGRIVCVFSTGFSDQAVTALGLYYKWQTFFFIPLGALQTCIVPVISFNYAAGKLDRCKKTLS